MPPTRGEMGKPQPDNLRDTFAGLIGPDQAKIDVTKGEG